jgi:8-oxo-dGTP pyrophosphatase MutT (NUDIX family)
MKIIKPAATIMLARTGKEGIEVLLLKRNKALKFAGGLWVFPGGKIEAIEQEQTTDDLSAAKLAAVRETQEEANIEVAPKDLIFFSHWTTPVIEPRRYATWFFFADVSNRDLKVQIDDSEVKDHLWVNPQAALDKVKQGQLGMMPPTYISLQKIRKCKTIAEVKKELQRTDPIFILPVLQFIDKKLICLYKGDAGYESGNAHKEGARHRLIANMQNGDFVFKHEDCPNFAPINGGMHL